MTNFTNTKKLQAAAAVSFAAAVFTIGCKFEDPQSTDAKMESPRIACCPGTFNSIQLA